MSDQMQDISVGLEITRRHVNDMLQEVFTKASELQESIVNRAATILLGYVANCWKSIEILQGVPPNQHEVTANSSAAILRVMYDALLQLMYIAHDPKVCKNRAIAYLEFGAIEHHTFMDIILQGKNALAQRIAHSHLRSAAETHIREEFNRVKNRYCGKSGKPRQHWYEGTLAGIAECVGKSDEYSWYVKMLSSSVHAGAFAAIRGPLPVNGDAFLFWAAMFVSQAANAVVKVSGIKLTEQARQIIATNGENLLNPRSTRDMA